MNLLAENHLGQIERRLADALASKLCAPGLAAFRDVVSDYVLAPGGKRVRPQLTAWTYLVATGGTTLTPAVLDVAAGWELFHAFLLVHDDIIDASHRRRDRPALHVSLARLDSDSLTFGTNLGIVAGDLLFSAAMCLWHELDVDATTHRELLKIFSKTACTTGFGQAIDICVSHLPMDLVDQETLLREYHWKTAAYTFEGPMLCGAALAGLGSDARAAISRFALAIGQAYQLHNDLLDLSTPAHAGCDLVQGKRTVALLQHRSALSDGDRVAFDARLASIADGGAGAVAMAETLRGEMLAGDATRSARRVIGDLLEEAEAATRDAALPMALASGMSTLLDAMTRQYFRSAATTA